MEIPADVIDAPASEAPPTGGDERQSRAAARVTKRHDRDAERAAAAAEKARVKDDEQRRRAEAKAASDTGSDERKAARAESAAAAAEQKQARQEARRHKAEAKQAAKAARAEAKREAKAARIEEREQAQAKRAEEKQQARDAKQQAKEAERQAKAARHKDQPEHEASDVHAAAGATAFGATSVVEPDKPDTPDEPTSDAAPQGASRDAETTQSSAPDRADELEATQPIGRVQDDREAEPEQEPEPEPKPDEKRRSSGIRGAAALVAAGVGILGLVFSVVLAIGALTVAVGAGEGNAIYDAIATVCNALAGPLQDAFNFSGPNAASREEFLGWGAGSLIYLAVSFAGQAAHRVGTRD